ncbi:alcohol dehydrogenase [Bifidobacterium pullorum subsp. saeculare]|uniref:Alcohol dehydrogenase n=1 Tax=Bifidobacterium pullorum subsp. saeculare TaxID=78257 RepID=A0A939B9M4_9BIFI|nr:alcohol dehydrogenase [Bifidobacterium pullorum subsp. saeculare]
MPWSHRLPLPARLLVSAAAGVAVGAIGSVAHRFGAAQNIPVGLLLAFLLLGLSSWCARSRSDVTGLAVHLITSSFVVWQMARPGPGGDILMPAGFSGQVPFFSEHASLIWLYGGIVLQLAMVFLPAAWFRVPPRKAKPAAIGA